MDGGMSFVLKVFFFIFFTGMELYMELVTVLFWTSDGYAWKIKIISITPKLRVFFGRQRDRPILKFSRLMLKGMCDIIEILWIMA